MRLSIKKSKNFEYFYIIKDYKVNGKRTTKVVEILGNLEQVKQKAGNIDYMDWIKKHIADLNRLEKDENRIISLNLSPKKQLSKNIRTEFNGGYLFLQQIYYDLGINSICDEITDRYQFKYDLNNILSNLIYSRILYPSSKLKTTEVVNSFIEKPNLDYSNITRLTY